MPRRSARIRLQKDGKTTSTVRDFTPEEEAEADARLAANQVRRDAEAAETNRVMAFANAATALSDQLKTADDVALDAWVEAQIGSASVTDIATAKAAIANCETLIKQLAKLVGVLALSKGGKVRVSI